MKKKYKSRKTKETREYNYITVRYIIAVLITLFVMLAIIGIVIACYHIPHFYTAAYQLLFFYLDIRRYTQ